MCVPGTSGDDRDPYAWLERLGAAPGRPAPAVRRAGRPPLAVHPERNAGGRIEAERGLARSGAAEVALILEVIPPFEEDDDAVLDDLRAGRLLAAGARGRERGGRE